MYFILYLTSSITTVYLYIVCEGIRDRLNVYNQIWHLIRTIGTKGSDDGELRSPQSAIVSDEDTIIISDWRNHRVSEFSFNGTFLRHLLVSSDGIYWPFSMSYYYPHLWLDQSHLPHNKLYRYNLYRSVNYLSIIFLKFYINYKLFMIYKYLCSNILSY